MVNVKQVKLGNNTRMSFSRINEVLDMPNLIEVQKNSYNWFLEEGLKEEMCIRDRTYTIAYGCGIVEAAKLAEEGKDAEMVLAFLENWFSSIEIYFSVYSLDFVKKSGRVSVAAAFVGELLGLRPIIRMLDGDPVIIDKVRGDKAILSRLLRAARESVSYTHLDVYKRQGSGITIAPFRRPVPSTPPFPTGYRPARFQTTRSS